MALPLLMLTSGLANLVVVLITLPVLLLYTHAMWDTFNLAIEQ